MNWKMWKMEKIENNGESITPDEVGALFDNPDVEEREDGYYMHFPLLEDLLTNHFL